MSNVHLFRSGSLSSWTPPARVIDPSAHLRVYGDRALDLMQAIDREDPKADALADVIRQDHRIRKTLKIWLDSGEAPTHLDVPRALRDFMEEIEEIPSWVDLDRVHTAGKTALRAGAFSGLALGLSSLVYGYCAPAGNKPLIATGILEKSTIRRLNETTRFVQAVCAQGGMKRTGDGFKITAHVRLMHASVRGLIHRQGTWKPELWGAPINQHDMVATILLFSSVLLIAMRDMGFHVSREEADDYIHLWRYIGHVIGVEHHLLPATEEESIATQYLIRTMQGLPDADSRALVDALLNGPPPAFLANLEALGFEPKNIPITLCRQLIGRQLADGLHLQDPVPYPNLLPRLRRVFRAFEWVRTRSAVVNEAFLKLGTLHWDHVVQTGLAGKPATFDPVQRLRRAA